MEFWLSCDEQSDCALLESLKPKYAEYAEKKYLVAVFRRSPAVSCISGYRQADRESAIAAESSNANNFFTKFLLIHKYSRYGFSVISTDENIAKIFALGLSLARTVVETVFKGKSCYAQNRKGPSRHKHSGLQELYSIMDVAQAIVMRIHSVLRTY